MFSHTLRDCEVLDAGPMQAFMAQPHVSQQPSTNDRSAEYMESMKKPPDPKAGQGACACVRLVIFKLALLHFVRPGAGADERRGQGVAEE